MTFLYYIAMLLLAYATRPRPPEPKAPTLSDFEFPTVDSSRSLPVAFGPVDVSGPNVAWYGDLRVRPIKKSSLFDTVTVGYKFYMGIHFTLSHRIDTLDAIYIGDRLAWSGPLAAGYGFISNPGLFGGEESEGGIQGEFQLLDGNPAQGADSYLVSKIGTPMPGFRGASSLVWRGGYIGTTRYPKAWSFRVSRTDIMPDGTAQWQPTLVKVNKGMNAAHIIREALTQDWGAAIPESSIDDASFLQAATTLKSEGFGLGVQWVSTEPVEDFIDRILEVIGGVRTKNPLSGSVGIKLLRDDYDPQTLPVFDRSNILSINSYERRGWGRTTNQVVLTWYNLDTRGEDSVTVNDLGSVLLHGGGQPRSETVTYTSIIDFDLAAKVATRELRAKVSPLSKLEMVVDRTGWDLVRGSVIVVRYDNPEIDAVFRVMQVDKGTLTDEEITLHLVEDIFSVTTPVNIVQQPSGWLPPNTAPAPMEHSLFTHATYWDLVRAMDPANIALLPADYAMPRVVAASAAGDLFEYSVYVSPNGLNTYVKTVAGDNSTLGYLVGSLDQVQDTFSLSGVINPEDASAGPQQYLCMGTEKMRIDSFDADTGVVQVSRAVLDTVPVNHVEGEKVWFCSQYGTTDTIGSYSVGQNIDVKLVPRTSLGELDLAAAPKVDVALTDATLRPYPAAALRINGSYYPVNFNGSLITIDWAGRNRLIDTGDLVPDNVTTSTAEEAGVQYTVEVRDGLDVLLDSAIVVPPTRQYVYDDSPRSSATLKIKVIATNTVSGLSALQAPEAVVSRGA